MKNLTAKQASELLYADGISKKRGDKSGVLMFREGYFYRHGNSPEGFAAKLIKQGKELDLNVEVVDTGDHWASFNGGASLAKSSHFWVEARVSQV